MRTHVTYQVLDIGSDDRWETQCLETLRLRRVRNQHYALDETDPNQKLLITEAEYDRLRALLTGENDSCRWCSGTGEVLVDMAYAGSCKHCKSMLPTDARTLGAVCKNCGGTMLPSRGTSLGEAWSRCMLCGEETRAPAPKDTRTLGQVAYGACRQASLVVRPWEHLNAYVRAAWEEVAAAVVEHERKK